jgi:uncharacterized protein YigE (DUF2233 family)
MTALTSFSAGVLLAALALDAVSQPLRRSETAFDGTGGHRVELVVLSAAPGQVRLTVLHPSTVIGRRDQPTSLKGMAATRELGRPRSAERYLTSAGFSSYRSDVPVGLLVSGGRTLSSFDSSPPKEASGGTCPASQRSTLRYSGVLCVQPGGEWQILPAAEYQSGRCTEAVQSGPMLIEPGGVIGICEGEATAARPAHSRLVACVDRMNVLHMVLSKPTALFPLANWLRTGPLKCDVALNLSGAEWAGWMRLPSPRRPIAKEEGGIEAELSSALLFESLPGLTQANRPP